uniref:NADH dehydrogenase subunit 2 n=1 Tax=Apatetica glabra TaxID=3044283 RepID=UPI002551D97D|nr:NADH dehydrogenase subunit 2 [Apatetica glabra]WGU20038.1 NADH dehydrogenase subunit 2 [Apatetica glabra]
MLKFYKLMFSSMMMIGTLITISSSTWMGMWIGLEINLLSIIPLMNSTKNNLSSEASLKYFITQTLASTMVLMTIILMSSNFSLNLLTPFNLMLNSALFMKMGAAPFHFWFPEVMEGLNWFNCLILLTWQKISPMIIMLYNLNYPIFMFSIILISMMISMIGLNQVSLRKFMAYSSINHIAWMIASMLIFQSIWTYYFLIYTIITMNIIFVFKILNLFFMKQLFYTLNENLLTKLFFIMNFLSLGGLPPFLGFAPKWFTIQFLMENNLYTISNLMIIMTLLALYYYMRLTFLVLAITSDQPSFMKLNTPNYFSIYSLNFVSILGLSVITLTSSFM